MADRVYPAGKPNPPPAAAAAATTNGNGAAAAGSFPAPKSQMYQRPIYRPQPAAKRRRGRSCRCSFCCCLCWLLLVLILLAFVAAVAGGAFYLLYRPQRPTFSVSAVRLAALNLTSSATAPALTSAVTLTITAKNPNKKVVYLYDDLALSAATAANGVPLGSATVPGFTHQAGNTTVISATLAANAVSVDPSGASSDIKKSGSMSVVLDAETRAGVRVGGIRTKKIGIQVHCEGIKVTVPAPPKKLVATKKLTTTKGTKGGKHNATAPAPAPAASHKHVAAAPAPAPAAAADDDTSAAATVSTTAAAHSCHVRVRVKIWRWTF